MNYKKQTTATVKDVLLSHNIEKYDLVIKKRWNPYTNTPVKEVGELCYVARRVINSDESRLARITTIIDEHKKVIVFYNFNYELEILKSLSNYPKITVAEYNGHKHDPIPKTDMWAYLVQYTAGAEGWNCIETNTIAFYSLNYSHRIMVQAAGRIDRINTSFSNLYYYRLVSNASIDVAILKALKDKKNFNESGFLNSRMKLML
jgi:hypothetical protein